MNSNMDYEGKLSTCQAALPVPIFSFSQITRITPKSRTAAFIERENNILTTANSSAR